MRNPFKRNHDLNSAKHEVAITLAATEFSSLILQCSHDATKDLQERNSVVRNATEEFPWLILEFAYFFHFMISLRLYSSLGFEKFKSLSDRIGNNLSKAWVETFFQGPAEGKAGFVRVIYDGDLAAGHDHDEILRSTESDRRFTSSIGFLAVRIKQRIIQLDLKELSEHLFVIVMNRLQPNVIETIIKKFRKYL